MTRASAGALLLLLASVAGAQQNDLRDEIWSETPSEVRDDVRMEPGKRVELSIPEAILAFSRHSSQARVLADDGSVYVAARQAGVTEVVVLTHTQVMRFNVVVGGSRLQVHARVGSWPHQENLPLSNKKSISENVRTAAPFPPETVLTLGGKSVRLQDVQVQRVVESGAAVAEVQAGRSIQINMPGATAALAIDSDLLDASAKQGIVDISGRAPGRAEVLIITSDGVKSIYILVSPAPPSYPPGFVSPVSLTRNENGSYEFRFASDPKQVQNRFDFTVTKPDRTTQIHFVNVDFLHGISGNGNADIPSGFYRVATPQWSFTLLDQNVKNSPLTLDGATVRGIHFGVGPWSVHAGYAPLASFYDFVIPTQREAVFGISHEFHLSPNSQLIQNAYYFPTHAQPYAAGHSGSVESLEYHLMRPDGLQLLGEVGFSHGIGGAVELQWGDPKDFVHGFFREKPKDFASLSIGNLPGSVAEFSWNRAFTPSLASFLNVSENHILLPTGQQTNLNSTASLQYKLSRSWSVSTGAAYSDFSQPAAPTSSGSPASLRSLSLPEQVNFDRKHFGAGFQYQFAKTSGSFHPGQDFRATARLTWSEFQLSGFAERQTEALTVSSLYSQIPSLQIELQRLGLTAINPSQLSALLQDNAFLLALGLSQQATLNLLPVRVQTGASFNWTSRGFRPQRLSLDFIRNNDQTVQGTASNWIQSGNYILPLTAANELSVSYSWFHYSALGQQYSPQLEIGLKHNFSALPSLLNPVGHGTLSGVVYVDDTMRGLYDPRMHTLAGVEVTLDGAGRTRTNEHGRYEFSHVPQGQHTVEAFFKSAKPFWFTTPSILTISINQTANFGITFAASELIGHIRNDAGFGVPDVEIEITGPVGRLSEHTDADGRFSASGLIPGDYELSIDANSVPPGYVLEDLKPIERSLKEGLPQNADFRIQAMRSVVGQVSSYDQKSGQYSPISDAMVKIPELSMQVKTDRAGKFILRELPSGSYSLEVSDKRGVQSRSIEIPPLPIELREDFRIAMGKN